LRYNPYLVGRAIWQSIEERWDKGQFGEEWERCKDAYEKKHWDKNLGLGRQKIFEVRKRYSDRFFIEHFLNKEIVDDLELYVYEQNKDGDFEPVETDPETIKKILVAMHTNFGIPYMVVDNDPLIREKGVLVLRHIFDELQLDEEYRQKTMEHIFYLWSKTILLKTKLIGKDGPYCVTFSYNPSKGHQKTENCKSGHCRH
jgi:stage V sporulation protein R